MKRPEFRPGDRVSHFREPGSVGKVVSLEKRGRWPFRYWAYWVRWRPGFGPVPHAHGLWPVRGTDVQQLDRIEVV